MSTILCHLQRRSCIRPGVSCVISWEAAAAKFDKKMSNFYKLGRGSWQIAQKIPMAAAKILVFYQTKNA